jgi:hypothetical protein
MSEKKISIQGTGNRYLIKKCMKTNETPKKRVVSKQWTSLLENDNEWKRLNEMNEKQKDCTYENKTMEHSMKKEIERKIQSYKHQDILKHKQIIQDYDSTFIDYAFILQKLVDCQLQCFYCQEKMLVLYETVRESKQWTVDRINNDLGHTQTNVVICCLECNLKRRRKNQQSFLFTKQLVLNKTNDNDDCLYDDTGDEDKETGT